MTAVIGGAIGSRVGKGRGRKLATIFGAIVGYHLGREMDKTDRFCTGQALEYVPNNQRTSWRNPDNGMNYTVVPTRTYKHQGSYCREYTTEALVSGRVRKIYGTACRQADGTWKAIK